MLPPPLHEKCEDQKQDVGREYAYPVNFAAEAYDGLVILPVARAKALPQIPAQMRQRWRKFSYLGLIRFGLESIIS